MKSESAVRTARSADQAVTQDAHVDAKEALTADLARLQDLLEHGNVEEARNWVRELSSRWPENDAVRETPDAQRALLHFQPGTSD